MPKRWPLLRTAVLLGLWALPLLAGPPAAMAGETFRWDRLAIATSTAEYSFRVEVAETPGQRSQGLQHRRRLESDAGMLFNFQIVGPVAMWMKNTYVPLDMLFIAADGKILNIARDTTPLKLTAIPSAGPVLGVLEIPAGTAAKLGIKAGDRVRHPIFK